MSTRSHATLTARLVTNSTTIGSLLVVPIYMLWEVLFVSTNVHLANPGRLPEASTVTDLDGAARLTYILSGMQFPWSDSPLVSSPRGAGIWRIETATQSIQVVFLWFMSRVFSPMISSNLLVLIGWFMTGVAVYWLCRTIGGGRCASLLAAWCVQLLPSLRFTAANFTSYVFICFPICVLICSLKYRQKASRRNLVSLVCGMLAVLLFDPYLALFSLLIVILVLSPEIVRLIRKMWFGSDLPVNNKAVLVWLSSVLLLGFLSVLPYFLSESKSDRTISVASRLDSRNSSLNLESWLFSPSTGVGTVLPLLFALSVVSASRETDVQHRMLVFVWGFFFLISTRFSIPNTDLIFAPAELIRFVLPGVRFFDRASLIAVTIAIVVGLVQSGNWTKRVSSPRRSLALQVLLFSLVATSLPNLSRPDTTKSFDDWKEVRQELSKVENPRVLALPFTRRGRDWIEQASFQAPLMNDYVESVFDREVVLQASHGPGSLAAFLQRNGVTHLILIPDELSDLLTYKFEDPRFTRVASILLNGFGEGSDFDAGLYSYSTLASDRTCNECRFGPYLIPKVTVSGDLVYPPDALDSGRRWWWTGEGNVEIESNFAGIKVRPAEAELGVKLSLSPCAERAQVTIRSIGQNRIVQLTSKMREATVVLTPNDRGGFSAQLQIVGESCIPSGDFRAMLVQVEPLVSSVKPR